MQTTWTLPRSLVHIGTAELPHSGDCHLLGVEVNPHESEVIIYAQEFYTVDDTMLDVWLAQSAVKFTREFTKQTGEIIQRVDEAESANKRFETLKLPADLFKPAPVQQTRRALHFTSVRERGLRETDRVSEWVHALTVAEKMALLKTLGWQITPMQLLGIAESVVLAEALMQPPLGYLVCQRLRLAVALPSVQLDAQRQPYDYETRVVYAARTVDLAGEGDPALMPPLQPFAGVTLHQPMDCLIAEDILVIADGGGVTQHNRLHTWRIGNSS